MIYVDVWCVSSGPETILMKFQQQAALMAAATAQGTYINPMAALATQIPHTTLNGMANSVVPPTSGMCEFN